jgi:hypothetical protein
MANEPMLLASEEESCFKCHGSDSERSAMKASGKLAEAAQLKDIESVFKKPYHHPVKEGSGHTPTEKLPDFTATSIQHAECVDCHNPHERSNIAANSPKNVSGYSLSRQYVTTSVYEYQICLKCHTDVTGLSRKEADIARVFETSVMSQHPVTKPFDGRRSVSLLSEQHTTTQMKCSDCHTNDDPDGPKGPHGSMYPYMLSANYVTDGYADESDFSYAFCYSCHDRRSILSNESFPLHREHIEGDLISGTRGTSCYTCHSAHSSRRYPNLLRFNTDVVSRNSLGMLEFLSKGENGGACYLSCHGYDHKPGEY